MKHRQSIRSVPLSLSILAALSLVTRPAPACGGPDMGDFGALSPADSSLSSIMTPGDYTGSWGQQQRDEFRFLYPSWKAHPRELDGLWRFSYGEVDTLAGPPDGPLNEALARGDVGEGERQAAAIVEAVYALPPAAAAPSADVLRRAVEVLELEPLLRKTPKDAIARFFDPPPPRASAPPNLRAAAAARQAHEAHAPLPPAAGNPRAPSIEYWTFQDHLKTRVPDGWSDALRQSVPPSTWTDLKAEVDGWIARHPAHSLADMARLAKIRVLYFAGDFDGAWDQALSLYPRRRVRALAEMRYLLLQGHAPSAAFVAKLSDPELETALLLQDGFDGSRWEGLWRASEGMPAGDVRVNLQERLLAWQAAKAKPGALPPSFPARPSNPSSLWGKLRAIALLRAGEMDRGLDQLQTLPEDPERDLLIAQGNVQAGHVDRAVELPYLSADVRAYLLGVRLDDASVGRHCQSTVPETRDAACFEQALRLARAGRWGEALPLVHASSPSARVALWGRGRAPCRRKGRERGTRAGAILRWPRGRNRVDCRQRLVSRHQHDRGGPSGRIARARGCAGDAHAHDRAVARPRGLRAMARAQHAGARGAWRARRGRPRVQPSRELRRRGRLLLGTVGATDDDGRRPAADRGSDPEGQALVTRSRTGAPAPAHRAR